MVQTLQENAEIQTAKLQVEYLTRAQRPQLVMVTPVEDQVRINGKTYTVPEDTIFIGKKARPTARIAEGNPVALAVWRNNSSNITAQQLDRAAHDNTLTQLYEMAAGNKSNEAQKSMFILILVGVSLLGVIASFVMLNNALGDLKKQVAQFHDQVFPPPATAQLGQSAAGQQPANNGGVRDCSLSTPQNRVPGCG